MIPARTKGVTATAANDNVSLVDLTGGSKAKAYEISNQWNMVGGVRRSLCLFKVAGACVDSTCDESNDGYLLENSLPAHPNGTKTP